MWQLHKKCHLTDNWENIFQHAEDPSTIQIMFSRHMVSPHFFASWTLWNISDLVTHSQKYVAAKQHFLSEIKPIFDSTELRFVRESISFHMKGRLQLWSPVDSQNSKRVVLPLGVISLRAMGFQRVLMKGFFHALCFVFI